VTFPGRLVWLSASQHRSYEEIASQFAVAGPSLDMRESLGQGATVQCGALGQSILSLATAGNCIPAEQTGSSDNAPDLH
jgi:hypothetical protein